MFLFFKWLLASSLAAVSGWWNEHIKRSAALTKRCGAGWLAGSLVPFAVRHLLKWQAGNKGPLATRESSVPLWSGQDNRAERWPGLLATCQLVSTTHGSNRAQRSGTGEEEGEGEWLTPACPWALFSMVDILTIHGGWKCKRKTEIGEDINVQVCRQTKTEENPVLLMGLLAQGRSGDSADVF